MNYRVAVRTNWAKITDRADRCALTNARNRRQVVYMNKPVNFSTPYWAANAERQTKQLEP